MMLQQDIQELKIRFHDMLSTVYGIPSVKVDKYNKFKKEFGDLMTNHFPELKNKEGR